MSSKRPAIIAGPDFGTGSFIASRKTTLNYEQSAEDIDLAGGRALGINTDISYLASVKRAMDVLRAAESELASLPP